jgi:hypothetical protein
LQGSGVYNLAGATVSMMVEGGTVKLLPPQIVLAESIIVNTVSIVQAVDTASEEAPDLAKLLKAALEAVQGGSDLEKRMYVLTLLQTILAVLTFFGLTPAGNEPSPQPDKTVIVQQIVEKHITQIQIFVQPEQSSEPEVKPSAKKPGRSAPKGNKQKKPPPDER